jgi:hypothetical protein
MDARDVVALKNAGIITGAEAREILGLEDALVARVERVKIELQAALDSKGGAIEWRDGIQRALRVLRP